MRKFQPPNYIIKQQSHQRIRHKITQNNQKLHSEPQTAIFDTTKQEQFNYDFETLRKPEKLKLHPRTREIATAPG